MERYVPGGTSACGCRCKWHGFLPLGDPIVRAEPPLSRKPIDSVEFDALQSADCFSAERGPLQAPSPKVRWPQAVSVWSAILCSNAANSACIEYGAGTAFIRGRA